MNLEGLRVIFPTSHQISLNYSFLVLLKIGKNLNFFKKQSAVSYGAIWNNKINTNGWTLSNQWSFKKLGVPLWKHLFLVLFIIGLVCTIYSNTLQHSDIFDDSVNIFDNKAIHLESLTLNDFKRVLTESNIRTRPIPNISFALNYYFHQDRVLGYRVVNILIHLTNGLLLYLFIKLSNFRNISK